MASLINTKIKNTYVSLLKVADNGQLDAALQDITDGAGNTTGIQLNTGGDLTASGTVAFGSLKDSGENITITKFVDAADGIGSNNNDTTIPTSAAVSAYVASQVTLEDLDFAGDSGTGAVDLDSQTLSIVGTANEITTAAGAQTLTIGLPSTIHVNVQGDLTGNVTATSVLVDGVTATTQLTSDNSTKVATTAFVKSVVTAENLDIAGTSGTGSVDLDSQVLTIAGTTNEIETSASGQTITVGLPSDVIIGNDLTVTTDASVGGTLDVTGATGIDGNFDIATNKFTVQAATGNTAVAGTLGVTGNTTLSTVDVTGLASLDGGIDVDGAFTVANTTGDISTSGTLGVTGITSLTDDLAVDTDTLFVDASADRVGINKNNPAVALDVVGDITSSGTITGTTLTGTLSTAAQTNITSVGTLSSLAVSGNLTVDTNTLFVDAANNRVGIGTSSPDAQLNIESSTGGVIRLSSTDTSIADEAIGTLEFYSNDASSGGTGVKSYIKSEGGPFGQNYSLTFGTAGTGSTSERMRIDASGRVGIGRTPVAYGSFNVLDLAGANGAIQKWVHTGSSVEAQLYASSTLVAIGSVSNNDVVFTRQNAERARITANGLTFNGDTAAANALDDYEEGTWTMGISFGGASAGVTYSDNTGTYTKIGRQVTVNGYVALTNKGSSTGVAVITGLPFTVGNTVSNYAAGSGYLLNVSFANQYMLFAIAGEGSIRLREITEAGAITDLVESNFANDSAIMVGLTYFV